MNVVAKANVACRVSSPIGCSASFPAMLCAYSYSFYNNVNWLKVVAAARPSERAPVCPTAYPCPWHSLVFLWDDRGYSCVLNFCPTKCKVKRP